MDKEVLGLSVPSPPKPDFYDLLYPRHEDQHQKKKDDILSTYDFHPIRSSGGTGGPLPSSSLAASMNLETTGGIIGGGRTWNSADAKANAASGFRDYDSSDPHESEKAGTEKDTGAYNTATVIEIDRTMKKHTDNLLHALEGVSARLSQMESRTQRLEGSVDELKTTIANNHGSIEGKLRQIENTLKEVQTVVQAIRDKQELAEAQLELAKLQVSQGDHPTMKNPNMLQTDSSQQTVSQPQESIQPQLSQVPLVTPQVLSLPHPNAALTQPQQAQVPSLPHPSAALPPPQQTQVPLMPHPNAPLPPPQQNLPVQAQLPQNPVPSMPTLPRDRYHPVPSQPMEAHHQQYQTPPQQAAPPTQYQGTPSQLPPYSQPAPVPLQHQPLGPVHTPSQPHPPSGHHPEESAYMQPPQTYPPSIRQPAPPTQPPAGSSAPQQIYGPPHIYEPSGSRPSSGQPNLPAGYSMAAGSNFSDSYPYGGLPSQYSGSGKSPLHSSPSAPTSGSNYPRLPTAQILPHALPTATSVSSGPSSGGSSNRVPVDDVIDKVAMMGFPRDQVRATVRKLTENGQSVDLNVVLDKLMNDGEIQPQKGWFGR